MFKHRVGHIVEAAGGVGDQYHNVGFARLRPGCLHHGAIEAAFGREDARRVDENDLAPALDARCRARAPAWFEPCG